MPSLTPDAVPATNIYKFIRIPDDRLIVGAVTSGLSYLTKEWAWEAFGDMTPAEIAGEMVNLLNQYINWSGSLIGSMMPYPGELPPDGCLPCDGEEYLREDYPELYAYLLGSPYAIDSDTFMTPYFPGRVVMAANEDYFPHDEVGAETHTLTVDEIPAHSHTYTPAVLNLDLESPGAPDIFGAGVGSSTNTGNTGGGDAHNNLQPSIAFNWCIVAGRSYIPPIPPPVYETLWGYAAPTIDGTGAPTGNFGTRIIPAVDGRIIGIKIYTTGGVASDYQGRLYNSAGTTVLGTATAIANINGWVDAIFSTPIDVTGGVSYVAAGFVVGFGAPYDAGLFTSAVINGNLTAPADNAGTGQRNGLFNTSGTQSFPFMDANAQICFFVDVIFEAD